MILSMNNAWNLLDEIHWALTQSYNLTLVVCNIKIEDVVLIMDLDMPGLSKKDINGKIEDSILLIKGENKNRTLNKRYNIKKDWDVTKTLAVVKDGVLTALIPKSRREKSKLIEVSVK